MKKYLFIITFLIGISIPLFVFAQTDCSEIDPNQPNEVRAIICKPHLQVTFPGLDFTDSQDISRLVIEEPDGSKYLRIPYLGEFISNIYLYSVIVISAIAIMVIIAAGIQWTASGGNQETIKKAQGLIGKAVLGILISAGSYLILVTINPALVTFDSLRIRFVKGEPLAEEFEVMNDVRGDGNWPIDVTPPPGATPLDLDKRENPIPLLIGPLPSQYEQCSIEAAEYMAYALDALNICVGPCHCAYSATHFLNYIGCPIEYSGSANTLRRHANSDNGWPEKNAEDISVETDGPGLLWKEGHVGIYVGNGLQFDSGAGGNSANWRERVGDFCPDSRWFYDVNPYDAQTSCQPCSLIPTESPISGRSGGSELRRDDGETQYVFGTNSAQGCRGIQVWNLREFDEDAWTYYYEGDTGFSSE